MALASSPKQLRGHVSALVAFKQSYIRYLEAGQDSAAGKAAVIKAIPSAQQAFDAAEINLVVADPPALGAHRQTYAGLQNVAFLHERPGFQPGGFSGGPEIYDAVLETADQAIAALENEAAQADQRRRSPLYWGDRILRTILAIPAYLVSLIIGESVVSIDRSAWGVPLRILGIVADCFGVYFAGRALGFW